MDAYVFKCTKCGQSLEADGDMTGEAFECPACHVEFIVPPNLPLKAERIISCVGCGCMLGKGVLVCTNCGADQNTGSKANIPNKHSAHTAPDISNPAQYRTSSLKS
jgi:hypothetical protein